MIKCKPLEEIIARIPFITTEITETAGCSIDFNDMELRRKLLGY